MGLFAPINLLWALGALLALVLIYLTATVRNTLDVSSLMLFDDIRAPIVRHRIIHVDALFWLQCAMLAAVGLALAGLFVRVARRPAARSSHAIVFDLGAAMGARDGSDTRLDRARRAAQSIVARAPTGTLFSVSGYARQPVVLRAPTTDRAAVRATLDGIEPFAVASAPAALVATLMQVRDAGQVDVFTDHASEEAIAGAIDAARLTIHRVGRPKSNAALVSLEPGIPRQSLGRAVIRSFADGPMDCTLTVASDRGDSVSPRVSLAPGVETAVSFGPLAYGGLVHAHLACTGDSLSADNDRWAWVMPADGRNHALVLSPDAAVREDLSRVLTGVEHSLAVVAVDPSHPGPSVEAEMYRIAIMHDCYIPDVRAQSLLLIFPPGGQAAGLKVGDTLASARLESPADADAPGDGLMVGRTRIVKLPPWMEVTAQSAGPDQARAVPLVAFGQGPGGGLGLVAFDVRDRILLNPDNLPALVASVELVKRLLSPPGVRIVSAGDWVAMAAAGDTTLRAFDGTSTRLEPDGLGRIGFRPLRAGQYVLTTGGHRVSIFANYFDASESDLRGVSTQAAAKGVGGPHRIVTVPAAVTLYPLGLLLALIALIALIAESILPVRGGVWRRRAPHV